MNLTKGDVSYYMNIRRIRRKKKIENLWRTAALKSTTLIPVKRPTKQAEIIAVLPCAFIWIPLSLSSHFSAEERPCPGGRDGRAQRQQLEKRIRDWWRPNRGPDCQNGALSLLQRQDMEFNHELGLQLVVDNATIIISCLNNFVKQRINQTPLFIYFIYLQYCCITTSTFF